MSLTKKQIELFWDADTGGFYENSTSDRSVLIRMKDDYDGAEPAGNSIAALNLLRLALIMDNQKWQSMAERTLKAFGNRLIETPEALPQMLTALCWHLSAPKEIILAGDCTSASTRTMLEELHRHFIPNKIVLLVDQNTKGKLASFLPFIRDINVGEIETIAYVCRNYTCQLPTRDLDRFRELLEK
jgi:uncharacterized protein YyaL (SSP411 family)